MSTNIKWRYLLGGTMIIACCVRGAIIEPPINLVSYPGEDVSFNCKPQDNETTMIVWSYHREGEETRQFLTMPNDVVDKSKSHHSVDRWFTLSIKNAQLNDSGKYSCLVAGSDVEFAAALVVLPADKLDVQSNFGNFHLNCTNETTTFNRTFDKTQCLKAADQTFNDGEDLNVTVSCAVIAPTAGEYKQKQIWANNPVTIVKHCRLTHIPDTDVTQLTPSSNATLNDSPKFSAALAITCGVITVAFITAVFNAILCVSFSNRRTFKRKELIDMISAHGISRATGMDTTGQTTYSEINDSQPTREQLDNDFTTPLPTPVMQTLPVADLNALYTEVRKITTTTTTTEATTTTLTTDITQMENDSVDPVQTLYVKIDHTIM